MRIFANGKYQIRMNLRKNSSRTLAVITAIMAMFLLVCVPHHHHGEAICIGNEDCKASKHHSHEDDCGGKDTKNFCCHSGQYVDFRSVDDDFYDCSVKDFSRFIAVIYDDFVLCAPVGSEVQHRVCLPEAVIVSAVFDFKALRSPPLF